MEFKIFAAVSALRFVCAVVSVSTQDAGYSRRRKRRCNSIVRAGIAYSDSDHQQ
jgi:hypothetical protein